MRNLFRILIALFVLTALGLVANPVGANGGGSVTGEVTPAAVDVGGSLTVTFNSTGNTTVCDDAGPTVDGDTYTYADRPLVVGLFPADLPLEPELNVPSAWYNDGTPLAELGVIGVAGILATSTYDSTVTGYSGWQGSFSGQFTVPAGTTPGAYNAVWGCGYEDEVAYDTGGTALAQPITINPGNQIEGISLTLDFEVGQNIRNGGAGVPVAGAGLLPGADYTVVLRSDPVLIGSGVNDPNGAFSAVYPVPPNTPGGAHSVTVTSLNTASEVVTAQAWFSLDDNGTVTSISYDGPVTPRHAG